MTHSSLGEGCKLFWPDKQEFVRMAVKFGATIVPFGVVGEDDMSELIIDYNEMKRIPFVDQLVNDFNQGRKNLRKEMGGEIAKQPLHFPIFLPKLPDSHGSSKKQSPTKRHREMAEIEKKMKNIPMILISCGCVGRRLLRYMIWILGVIRLRKFSKMALIVKTSTLPLSPFLSLDKNFRLHSHVLMRSVRGEISQASVSINGASSVHKKDTNGGKKSGQNIPEELEPLWDDGYGTQTAKDYAYIAMDLIKSDGGPPRWFCPIACGTPLKDSPILLYIPGIDGTGTGLVVHEKALGKVFHVQCLHIPVHDRTPFEGLLQIVEETIKIEHDLSPNKPIYLLGESFGGTLALSVAARNPTIDLILILANPATSFERSQALPLYSLMKSLPEKHYEMLPYVIPPILGDFVKMAMVKIDGTSDVSHLWQFLCNFTKDLPNLSMLSKILPQDTLKWRIKLVESAAAYANSRLHAITAQVLVLASGKDNLVPSKNEAQRLSRLLKHCNIRVFEENGHTILLESGVNLLSTIKTSEMYRRFSKHDFVKDFLPLSMTEFKSLPIESRWYRVFMGAAMFSTMEDGKIVRGLSGIPNEGPVLIVGNHLLLGFDIFPLLSEFLKEKKVILRGLAHPQFFQFDEKHVLIPCLDVIKLFGAIPVSGINLFKLLARKSYTLLYPGGLREALYRKGENSKLFWPEKQEFVRMAVKFGATIIPFGVVGEDDISEIIIDYNEMKRIPFINQMLNDLNQGKTNLREGMVGEIGEQRLHIPIIVPKLTGRLYYMFGKPIRTKRKEKFLDDKDYIKELYLQIKCEVEKNVAYLLKKREEDPYRGLVERLTWLNTIGSLDQIPSFEP
ncbi:hypothetical protein L2E82_48019 [Cichorium intybus]|uniref:Uncharacterized protein n=1 Tax=Cichorium intybus TaxID=13427 RepID=A0ACB8YW96_CICIN|nr:hypothetical protein L2E82_48019 [Cichorium intybus]